MIDISHQQAQFLLRRAADRKLPEEQWAALQAHLEGCGTCRAYQLRLDRLQKNLRRALRSRWRFFEPPGVSPAPSTSAGLAHELARIHTTRLAQKKRVLIASLALLALVLLVVALPTIAGWPQAAPATALDPTQTAAPTLPAPTLTPLPGERFQGLVVFESRRTGDSEIFLLQAAGGERELTNLTQHPAEDTSPAWSPDGEWLAFLSDRALEGKRELYVISVAGSSLTQITNDPDINWEGPLEWSSDGRWITLGGRRAQQGDEPWIYLVPLDGRGPVSVPGSRGAALPAGSFSSLGPILAARDVNGRIFTYNPLMDWRSEGLSSDALLPGSSITEFAWVSQGNNLLYLLRRSGRTHVVWSSGQVRLDGADFRSLAPHPNSPMVALLEETPGTDCARLHLFHSVGDTPPVTEVSQLCVLGDLQRTSWAPIQPWPAGAWGGLLVAAQPAEQPSGGGEGPSLDGEGPSLDGEGPLPGIYALRVPYVLSARQPWPQERLADLAPGESPALIVRPSGESLGIRPIAAAEPQPAAMPLPEGPSGAPPDLEGSLLLVEPAPGADERSALVEMRPDGSGRRVLLPAVASHTCPAWSPDRSRVVFLSDRASRGETRGPDEIFMLEISSGEISQLTRMSVTGRAANSLLQRFGCPVWSPNGKYLAATTQVGQGSAVLVIAANGQVVRSALVSRPSEFAELAWTPDSQEIILAQPAQRTSPPALARVPWRLPVAANTLLKLEGFDDFYALSISPDGEQLAFIYFRYGSEEVEGAPAAAHLRVVRLADMEVIAEKMLPLFNPGMLTGQGRITWLPDDQLVLAIPLGGHQPDKAKLLRYDLAEDSLQIVALVEDALYDWALDGDWLVYSSESGLWGVPAGGGAPIRLNEISAISIDWR